MPSVLIAVLLGCPLVCLSETPAAVSGGGGCCAHAGCCSKQPVQDCPREDDSDGRSKDCVCGGATAPGLSEKDTFHQRPAALPGGLLIAVAAKGVSDAGAWTPWPAPRFPLFRTGREICALTGVLLL